MRRSEDAKMRRGFKEIWDAKMRRCDDAEGFLEFWRPQNTKMRRCQDATMRDWLFYHPALLYCLVNNHLTQIFCLLCGGLPGSILVAPLWPPPSYQHIMIGTVSEHTMEHTLEHTIKHTLKHTIIHTIIHSIEHALFRAQEDHLAS